MSDLFVKRLRLNVSAEKAFQWHERPGALDRLTPPWSRARLAERSGGIKDGGRVVLVIPVGPFPLRWEALHFDYIENRQFRDRQTSGPFALWDHTHSFEPLGEAQCDLEDRVEYAPPLGGIGRTIGGLFLRPMLQSMFAYRHRITAHDLSVHERYGGRRLHFLISGASGLIGSQLCPFLTTGGHQVTSITRHKPKPGEAAVWWNPASGQIDTHGLPPVDVVVHLAGENIARRWTADGKARIRDSRGPATRRLCESLARLQPRPSTFISASAIGFYGDRGATVVDESSSTGSGFLAEVCRDWEAATTPVAGVMRVVHLRFGVVLSAAGGALAKLLLPFQLGVGGRLGNGQQYMSWIGIDDALTAVLHAAGDKSLTGPLNVVAPQPVTNAELTSVLGKVLRRPTLIPVPAAAARLAFGEMADKMLLASARVEPTRLRAAGFSFWHEDVESALRHTLGR
ncbi:MAG: TIGR01777 family protein [Deltaproteobacteria bacterium]|nr:TIGR01777 family protein [Deltaproteobacteria bacterium]